MEHLDVAQLSLGAVEDDLEQLRDGAQLLGCQQVFSDLGGIDDARQRRGEVVGKDADLLLEGLAGLLDLGASTSRSGMGISERFDGLIAKKWSRRQTFHRRLGGHERHAHLKLHALRGVRELKISAVRPQDQAAEDRLRMLALPQERAQRLLQRRKRSPIRARRSS